MGVWGRLSSWWRKPAPPPPVALARTPRHAELEAQLAAAPSLALSHIYADWLLDQGSPWGELMAVQLELEQATDLARWREIRDRELALHRAHPELLGPLSPWFERGFIVRLHTHDLPGGFDELEALLREELPLLRFVRELEVPRALLDERRGDFPALRRTGSPSPSPDPRLQEPIAAELRVVLQDGQVGLSLRGRLPSSSSWLSLLALGQQRWPYGGTPELCPLEAQTPLSLVCWTSPWSGRRDVEIALQLTQGYGRHQKWSHFRARLALEVLEARIPLLLRNEGSWLQILDFPERGYMATGDRETGALPEPLPVPSSHPRLPELPCPHLGASPPCYHPQTRLAARLLSLGPLGQYGIAIILWRDHEGKQGFLVLPDHGQDGQIAVLPDGNVVAQLTERWRWEREDALLCWLSD